MNFRNDFFIKVLIMSVFIDNNFRYPENEIGLTIINGDIARLELMIQHLKELKEIITKKMMKNQTKDVIEQPKSTMRYRPKSTQQIDDLDESISKTQPSKTKPVDYFDDDLDL